MFEASPRTARHREARFLTAVDVVRKPCGDATGGNHSEAAEEMESDGTSRRESLECRSRREPIQFGSDARGKRNTRCGWRRDHAYGSPPQLRRCMKKWSLINVQWSFLHTFSGEFTPPGAMDLQPYRSYAANSRSPRCNPQQKQS